MSGQELFQRLPLIRQKEVHLLLCEDALSVWHASVAKQKPITYIDTVVGIKHEVDVNLPEAALLAAKRGLDNQKVGHSYAEPIAAMQDCDLKFPDAVEFAYYAIYNCFRLHACKDDIDAWLIVNQALASNDDKASWLPRFDAAIAKVS